MIRPFLQFFSGSGKKRGAVLLVTLGILTVLGTVIAVFLTVSRIRQRTMEGRRNIQQVEELFDRSLQTVIHDLEEALSPPRFAEEGTPDSKRLVPVNVWFSKSHYDKSGAETSKITPECGARVLLSRTEKGREGQSVQLLTPAVLQRLPPAVTRELAENVSTNDFSEKFKSGWIYLEDPAAQLMESDLRLRIRYRTTRISYALVNVSDQLDANCPLMAPTSNTLARQVFDAADLPAWIRRTGPEIGRALETNLPFTAYSYDPDPEVVPVNIKPLKPLDRLGYHTFDLPPPADLNEPGIAPLLATINAMGPVSKFRINAITNFIPSRSGYFPPLDSTAWYNDAGFKACWWEPVVSIVNQIRANPETGMPLPGGVELAWNIANFMDPDRIPQISTFSADPDTQRQLFPTRINHAVEALPMINRVALFNLFDEQGREKKDLPGGRTVRDYLGYTPKPGTLSNHYAVAVQLWYPYAPLSPFRDDYNGDLNPACYIGIYTSQTDAAATTNAPWTSPLLRDWMKLHAQRTGETAYETLFHLWSDIYTAAQGPMIWTHPLWQAIHAQKELWFTDGMQTHPYWPTSSNTNGTIDIESSFLWQAFQTGTVHAVATNVSAYLPHGAAGPVTKQVMIAGDFMPLTVTNSFMGRVSGGRVQKIVQFSPGNTRSPLPRVTWSGDKGMEVQEWSGFISGGVTNSFDRDRLFSNLVMDSSNRFRIVSSVRKGNAWAEEDLPLDTLLLDTNRLPVATIPVEDLGVMTEIVRPEPLPDNPRYPLLPMVSALIETLPTNSVTDLYTVLMQKPADGNLAWDRIFASLSSVPGLIQTLFPSRQVPAPGKLGSEERYPLTNREEYRANGEIHFHNGEGDESGQFMGSYWTVFPKKVVTFENIVTSSPADGAPGERFSVTNYMRIGYEKDKRIRRVWIRPVVTIRPSAHFPYEEVENGLVSAIDGRDIIVDEALLQNKLDQETPYVFAWANTNAFLAKDPRNNALMNQWKPFRSPSPSGWEAFFVPTNGSEIAELPFIHLDRPLEKIGELGHVYASLPAPPVRHGNQMPRDTLTFSTRTGAALLDFFTASSHPPHTPVHGKVQANTVSRPILEALFDRGEWGWQTGMEGYGQAGRRSPDSGGTVPRDLWVKVYADALTQDRANTGWRSFTEMLPALNRISAARQDSPDPSGEERVSRHPLHDDAEDAFRHLPELLSFRQSIYHIVLCVQTLSPGSTPDHPEPLAERRVFITILRDSFTGRWMVAGWKWLD